MGLLIFAIIFSVIVSIFILVFISYGVNKKGLSKKHYAWILTVPVLFFIILSFGMFVKIEANEVGIIYHDQKGVLEEVKLEGFQTKSIFEHITPISTTNKTAALTVAGQTKDSAYADFMITIVYRIDAPNAGKFFKKTSSTDINPDQLNSLAKEALQSATIKYDIYGILGDQFENVRQDFVSKITELAMERYSITIVSASFDDVDAGERIEESIRRKAEALQQVEIAEVEKRKAEIEALTAKIKAEADAEVLLINAQAEADQVELAKTAIANMISYYLEAFPTLTEKEVANIIMTTIYYEVWDGKLPNVIGGDASIIIPMPEN